MWGPLFFESRHYNTKCFFQLCQQTTARYKQSYNTLQVLHESHAVMVVRVLVSLARLVQELAH